MLHLELESYILFFPAIQYDCKNMRINACTNCVPRHMNKHVEVQKASKIYGKGGVEKETRKNKQYS